MLEVHFPTIRLAGWHLSKKERENQAEFPSLLFRLQHDHSVCVLRVSQTRGDFRSVPVLEPTTS